MSARARRQRPGGSTGASMSGQRQSQAAQAQAPPLSLDEQFAVLNFVSISEHRTLLCVCKSWRQTIRRLQHDFVPLAEACKLKRERSAHIFEHMWATSAPLLGDWGDDPMERGDTCFPHSASYAYPTAEPPQLEIAAPPAGAPYRALALQYFDLSGSEFNSMMSIYSSVHQEMGQLVFAPCALLALAEACEWALTFAHLLFDLFEYPETRRSACTLGEVWDRIDRGEAPTTSLAAFSASLLRPVPVLARCSQLDGAPLYSGTSFAERMGYRLRYGEPNLRCWAGLFTPPSCYDELRRDTFDEEEVTREARSLKVADLRVELAKYGEEANGTKSMLVQQLVSAKRAVAQTVLSNSWSKIREAPTKLPYAVRHATFLHHWMQSAAEHERCRSLPPDERDRNYFDGLPPPPPIDVQQHDPNWLIICTAFLPAFASKLDSSKQLVERARCRMIHARHVLMTLHRSPTDMAAYLSFGNASSHATLAWAVFGEAAAASIVDTLASRQSEIRDAAIRQGLARDQPYPAWPALQREVQKYAREIGCEIDVDDGSESDDYASDEDILTTEDESSDDEEGDDEEDDGDVDDDDDDDDDDDSDEEAKAGA